MRNVQINLFNMYTYNYAYFNLWLLFYLLPTNPGSDL